jgi:threonyl-tRNA synthetase
MRSVLFHAKNFNTKFHSLANRPKGIVTEKVQGKENQSSADCIVVFITVEKKDKEKEVVNGISQEILKMSTEISRKNIVLVPFAHLSNNLADPSFALKVIQSIESTLKEKLEVMSAHFGSNKSLLLEIYGHAGNARYREF